MRKFVLLITLFVVVAFGQCVAKPILELDGGTADQEQLVNEQETENTQPADTAAAVDEDEVAITTADIDEFLAEAANYVRSLPDDEKQKMEFQDEIVEEEEPASTEKENKDSSKGVWKALQLSRAIFQKWVAFSNNPNLRNIYYNDPIHGIAETDETWFESDPAVCADLVDWLLGQERGSYYNKLVRQAGKGGSVLVMCNEDPETGEKHFKAETTSNAVGNVGECGDCDYEVVGAHHGLSPIIVDVNFLGEPDLLAGPDWKKNRSARPEPASWRKFDLDNKGPAMWEWVGPKSGLLVWSDQGADIQPTGHNLFGNVTWGGAWHDGYQPLASLDENKDNKLTKKELENLYIWLDANSDAVAQSGEIKSLADLEIVAIGVNATRDRAGNAHKVAGFETKDGQKGATWDWWSRRGKQADDEAVVYAWKPLPKEARIPGGVFVFNKDANGKLQMTSFLPSKKNEQNNKKILGFKLQIERNGNNLHWESVMENEKVYTNAIIEDGKIIGVTRVLRDGVESLRYSWYAIPTGKATL